MGGTSGKLIIDRLDEKTKTKATVDHENIVKNQEMPSKLTNGEANAVNDIPAIDGVPEEQTSGDHPPDADIQQANGPNGTLNQSSSSTRGGSVRMRLNKPVAWMRRHLSLHIEPPKKLHFKRNQKRSSVDAVKQPVAATPAEDTKNQSEPTEKPATESSEQVDNIANALVDEAITAAVVNESNAQADMEPTMSTAVRTTPVQKSVATTQPAVSPVQREPRAEDFVEHAATPHDEQPSKSTEPTEAPDVSPERMETIGEPEMSPEERAVPSETADEQAVSHSPMEEREVASEITDEQVTSHAPTEAQPVESEEEQASPEKELDQHSASHEFGDTNTAIPAEQPVKESSGEDEPDFGTASVVDTNNTNVNEDHAAFKMPSPEQSDTELDVSLKHAGSEAMSNGKDAHMNGEHHSGDEQAPQINGD